MKRQHLLSGKNKINISKCCLLKFLPRLLSVKFITALQIVTVFCIAITGQFRFRKGTRYT